MGSLLIKLLAASQEPATHIEAEPHTPAWRNSKSKPWARALSQGYSNSVLLTGGGRCSHSICDFQSCDSVFSVPLKNTYQWFLTLTAPLLKLLAWFLSADWPLRILSSFFCDAKALAVLAIWYSLQNIPGLHSAFHELSTDSIPRELSWKYPNE